MRSVLNLFHQEYENFVMRFSWMYQMAHLLQAQTGCAEAQSQLLACMQQLKHRSLPTDLWHVVTYVEKLTVACAPYLFEYLKQPLLPRTHHALERFIGRIKQCRRHITGRKTTQACILREGRFVATLFGLPHTNNWGDACSRVHPDAFHHSLHLLRQPEQRRKCW
jgi:hypothetical protein